MKKAFFTIFLTLVFLVPAAIAKTSFNFQERFQASASGLISDTEIRTATFVDLDFSAFPELQSNTVPSTRTIYVAPAGNDTNGNGSKESPYRTLIKGVNEAAPGDTVVVRAGSYSETAIHINTPNLTLMAFPGEWVEMVAADGASEGIVISADNFTLRGINIRGYASVGILFGASVNHLVFADLTISDTEEGIAAWGSESINGFLVYRLNIRNVSLIGLHCGSGYAYNWRIEDSTIDMTGSGGDSGADAFAVEHGDNILLVNNTVTGASADGIDTKATRVVVYGCHVHHIERNGIKLWHGGDIINSLVHHTGADSSIVVEEGPKTRLLNTTVAYHNFGADSSYNLTFGYDSQETMDVEIINSIIFNTSGGMYMNPNCNVAISHSLFHGMENSMILTHGSFTVYLSQGPAGLNRYGLNNLVAPPRLNTRFHALVGAPVIDAGVRLSKDFPIKDMSGTARVKGAAPDLGSFEDY